MPLSAGSRVGSYEIVSALGAGGMGEVYLARDQKLQRDVALKVLPDDVADSPDRLSRFEREARALATLNHPNIAQIYGVEDRAIVMEMVDGEDLAARLARGALPVEEALGVARQIADALDAAHAAGIVHRDLKPANIKIRSDGTVKVLDFGLAKSSTPATTGATMTSPAVTQAGVILGTAAYMSPEQARGKPVDKRTDIWAFGCVLFEMLTAQCAFGGETVTDVLGAIVKTEPEWSGLPAGTPPAVRRLLRRCLQKDPSKRLRDIGDAVLEIDAPVETTVAPHRLRSVSRGALAGVITVTTLAGAAIGWLTKPAPVDDRPTIRAMIALPDTVGAGQVPQVIVAVSPDGRYFATATNTAAYVRRVDQVTFTRLPQTDGARGVFFSPDSQWVGYWDTRRLGRVAVDGSSHAVIHDPGALQSMSGASWGDDGVIHFATTNGGIYSVPARGGQPRQVVEAVGVSSPTIEPELGLMFFSRGAGGSVGTSAEIIARSVESGEEVVVSQGYTPRYVNGRLFFVRGTTLVSALWDGRSRRLARDPATVAEGVARVGLVAQYDVSTTGTIAYLPGNSVLQPPAVLRRVSRTGAIAPLSDVERQYSDPRLSPAGDRVALHVSDQDDDVWVQDLTRGTQTRITFDPREDETAVWSPDGAWLAYSGFERAGSKRAIFKRRSDGSGEEEVLWTGESHAHVTDWTAESTLVVEVVDPQRLNDILTIDATGKDRTAQPLIATRFSEHSARVSPNGRLIAYASNESGRLEVYVQAYPKLGNRVQVSTSGGAQPVWSRDGSELYFRSDDSLLAARLNAAGQIAGAPVTLYREAFGRPQGSTHTTFEALPDGQFLFIEPQLKGVSGDAPTIIAVFNALNH
jgi:WD40 repeat protein